jgi:TonB family protein
MTAEHALEVQTVFRGVVIGTKYVQAPSRHRSVRSNRHARRYTFAIGSSAHADAPAAPAFLRHLADDPRGVIHPLIEPERLDASDADTPYAITLAPGMSGTIYDGARTQALSTTADGLTPGPRVALARHAHARLDCGAVTFLVSPAERTAALPPAPFSWRAIENRYHLGTALGVAILFLLMLATPSDPRALAFDVMSIDRRMVTFMIKPPVQLQVEPRTGTGQSDGGKAGRAAKGPPGMAGSETARERNRRLAVKGNAPPEKARIASTQAPIDARHAGVLGVFERSEAVQTLLAEGPALGSESDNVIANLVAGPAGSAFGHGGLGSLGTGRGGVGTGEGTLGIGGFGTVGFSGGGGPDGQHYGQGVGALAGHRKTRVPEILQSIGEVRGSLDREIIRRIIRRHINEVRFCYEKELAAHRDLSGRMVVQFNIAPTGQVLASVLQSSTVGNVRVESCTVQAVRRWEFPKPYGGGMTTVSYPFVFAPAGGGAD